MEDFLYWLFLDLVVGIPFGFFIRWIAIQRELPNPNRWFWWGFFFGIFAFIAVFIKNPDISEEYVKRYKRKPKRLYAQYGPSIRDVVQSNKLHNRKDHAL